MSTRLKKRTGKIKSEAEFFRVVEDITAAQLLLDLQVAEFNKKRAEEDKAFKAEVAAKKKSIADRFDQVETYAQVNRPGLLGDKQTGESASAFFGFRKSPGVLKPVSRKWTWAKVLGALKAAGEVTCITMKETVNKRAVMAGIPEDELARFGLTIDKPEDFFVEPKRAVGEGEKLKS